MRVMTEPRAALQLEVDDPCGSRPTASFNYQVLTLEQPPLQGCWIPPEGCEAEFEAPLWMSGGFIAGPQTSSLGTATRSHSQFKVTAWSVGSTWREQAHLGFELATCHLQGAKLLNLTLNSDCRVFIDCIKGLSQIQPGSDFFFCTLHAPQGAGCM